MKESKFIELLNLYIDRQISTKEAELLETEISNSPRHQQIYRQYCRMHRACTMVLENLGTTSTQSLADARETTTRIVKIEPAVGRPVWGYYAAGLAAAACLTLVAVQVYRRPARVPAENGFVSLPVAQPTSSAAGLMKVTVPVRMDATTLRDRGMQRQTLIAERLSPWSTASAPTFLPLTITALPEVAPLMQSGSPGKTVASPARPGIEQFVFQSSSTLLPDNPRIFRSRQSTDGQTEMTAYQFQR